MRAMRARPPITPPTIAPTGVLELVAPFEVLVGAAVEPAEEEFGVEDFGVEDFGVEVFGVEVFGVEVFGVEVLVRKR